MSIGKFESTTNLGDVMKSSDLVDVKETKAYGRGEESTDDQAYSSTDEGLSNSDSDSSSSCKRTSAVSSQSPSRRNSNASVDDLPEKNITELLPSVGSASHFTGECSRCCFFPKGRCNNGKDCTFCHFDHERRPRRSKRGGAKNKTDEQDTTSSSDVQVESSEQTSPKELAAPAPVAKDQELAAAAPVIVKPPGLQIPEVISCDMTVLPPPLPAFPVTGAMQGNLPYGIPTPMGYNSARFCPAPAILESPEAREAVQMRKKSGGKPVKVWLPETACLGKQLQRTIPAKKRPPYPESVAASRPVLDLSQPVKKRVPVFSEGFLESLFSEVERICAVPTVVPSAPAVLAPAPAVLVPR